MGTQPLEVGSEEEQSSLVPPLRLTDIEQLSRQGVLASRDFFAACQIVRDDKFWTLWLSRALLVAAVGQILAGVVFFFAYNWADLPAFSKFALIETGIVAAGLTWWRFGFVKPIGQAAGVAVTMLLGVLLAVFGQVYQTGADEYQLFLAWAALSLPFAIAGRSPAHWLVWVFLLNIAATLFLAQFPYFFDLSGSAMALILLALNAGIVLIATHQETATEQPAWFRHILVILLLVVAVTTVIAGLFESKYFADAYVTRGVAVLLPIVAAGVIYYHGRFRVSNLFMITAATTAALAIVFLVVLKVDMQIFRLRDFSFYFVLGLAGPALVGIGIKHLRRLSHIFDKQGKADV